MKLNFLKMIFRKNFLPRTYGDILCCIVVFLLIPYVYVFEIFIVLPFYYKQWTFWYNVHFAFGNFVTLNLVTNLLALMLCDTSVKGRLLSSEMRSDWRFCSSCESIVPPRSWHCDVCRTCILKRDHHCVFSGCCIGHTNNRYFIMFLLYVVVATFYSTYFNTFFIHKNVDFSHAYSFLNFVFPLAMFLYENTISQFYLLTYLLIVIAMVFTGVLLYFHVNLMLLGQNTHEKNYNILCYNYGRKRNTELVLGCKWYLVWISPFVISRIPHNGIDWIKLETLKNK